MDDSVGDESEKREEIGAPAVELDEEELPERHRPAAGRGPWRGEIRRCAYWPATLSNCPTS
ncbi:hypothetical protein [Streptomyces sp. CoH27]|uniref:hypothetical protein n=1 Tax=Streptomyces sp. CoH27 TaxID=2875763 RepID=UPI001CD6B0AE|nr:hypothetical protein [Streptomyces sp. CoH27]